MVSHHSLIRPSLGRRRATSALEAICRTVSKKASPALVYPLTPPPTPSELSRTPRRWAPSPGAPLKGRKLATLAITDGGRRRYVVDLQTGDKFWAVEMPTARLGRQLEDNATSRATLERSQRQQRTPPQTP